MSEVQHVGVAMLPLAAIDPANWGYMGMLNCISTFLKHSVNESKGQQLFNNHKMQISTFTDLKLLSVSIDR